MPDRFINTLFPDEATIPAQRSRHAVELRDLVRRALKDERWMLGAAAEALDVPASSLQQLIVRLGLREEYAKHSPGRGRPKSTGAGR